MRPLQGVGLPLSLPGSGPPGKLPASFHSIRESIKSNVTQMSLPGNLPFPTSMSGVPGPPNFYPNAPSMSAVFPNQPPGFNGFGMPPPPNTPFHPFAGPGFPTQYMSPRSFGSPTTREWPSIDASLSCSVRIPQATAPPVQQRGPTVYIGHLTPDTDDAVVRQLLSVCGVSNDVKIRADFFRNAAESCGGQERRTHRQKSSLLLVFANSSLPWEF